MAIRLGDHVRRGTIDNSVRGEVRGSLEVEGMEGVLELKLKGNALPDMAGCVLSFVNPDAKPAEGEVTRGLSREQTGVAGDITAARKCRVPTVPIDTYLRLNREEREASESLRNTLYLEWYSEANGRIVIEGIDFEWDIDLPRWTLSEEEFVRDAEASKEAVGEYLKRAAERFRSVNREIREAESKIDPNADDEFVWEKRLKEADRRNDAFHEMMEQARDEDAREALMEMAYPTDDRVVPEDPIVDEDEIESERFFPDDDTIDLCRLIRKRCKELAGAHYPDLVGTEVQGEFLSLIVKSQTVASMIQGDEIPYETGFLIARVKREMERSRRALDLLGEDKSEPVKMIRSGIWEIRDLLVQLAGKLRE